ncbi:hypothetical protein A2U01_0099535, partial [Trifolium medium]|nr:hypothetical protein [Trifolium medium]
SGIGCSEVGCSGGVCLEVCLGIGFSEGISTDSGDVSTS